MNDSISELPFRTQILVCPSTIWVIFFVDFPSLEERRKILEIHISKLKRDLSNFDLDKLAKLSGEEKFGKDVVNLTYEKAH